MALIDKPAVEAALRNQLTIQLRAAAEELIIEGGKEVTDELRVAITRYTNKQAAKMAIAINVGLASVYTAIDENTNKINQLETRINGLATATTTTP